jgi:hypothetical protein
MRLAWLSAIQNSAEQRVRQVANEMARLRQRFDFDLCITPRYSRLLVAFYAATPQELIYPHILIKHHAQEFQNRIEFRVVLSLFGRELPA